MRGAVVLVLALLVAACADNRPSAADHLVADAEKAAESARAVHISGTIAEDGGSSVDFEIVKKIGAEGRMTQGGRTARFVRLGKEIYLRANAAFWRMIGGAEAAQLLQGRWLRVPVNGSAAAPFARLANVDELFRTALRSHGPLRQLGTATYRGRKAIVLEDTGSSGGTLYIAARGPRYPLGIEGANGSFTFDGWNRPASIEAPKDALDLSQITGTGSRA